MVFLRMLCQQQGESNKDLLAEGEASSYCDDAWFRLNEIDNNDNNTNSTKKWTIYKAERKEFKEEISNFEKRWHGI